VLASVRLADTDWPFTSRPSGQSHVADHDTRKIRRNKNQKKFEYAGLNAAFWPVVIPGSVALTR
jgi:hypothetical protein